MEKENIIYLIQERKDIMNFLDTIMDHENGGYTDEKEADKYVERLIDLVMILDNKILSSEPLNADNEREKSSEELYNECMGGIL